MAYLIPADKGTHYLLGSVVALVFLPLGWPWALLACAAAAIGREVYGRTKRGQRMNRADWTEAARDIGATLAGGAAVLCAAFVGV